MAMMLTTTLLSGCGGGSDSSSTAASSSSSVAATTLQGSVAVGAPMTDGKLTILDATGNVVVQNLTLASDGSYAGITLTGPAPYRLEACGYVGAQYTCLHSVVQGAGTGNVTPLTEAIVLLATGEQPGDVMQGNANLDANAISDAQTQLHNTLSNVLSDAGVGNGFDFITGDLNAGSRTGYDRVLDAVGVNTGEDANAFVQITPRLGTGNVYIEAGSAATGSITVDSNASNVSLSGIETLFLNMSSAVASANACSNGSTGMASLMASDARMSMGNGFVDGAAQVGAEICQFFASGGEGGGAPIWGSQLISPKLGRCDFSGADPICRISFALKNPEGEIANVGDGMGVKRESNVWKFFGNVDPIEIHANATAQRDRRIDATGATLLDTYARALQFDIQAAPNLQCAQIEQPDENGDLTTVAFYKLFDANAPRLSLWLTNGMSQTPSTDPNSGALRSSDDTWITLPDGANGDAVVRNFFRGGRTVKVSLFSDSACATPLLLSNNRSTLEVDVQGVPPVFSALPSQAWASFDSTTLTALIALDIPTSTTGSFTASFGFEHGSIGMNDASLCAGRNCGQGSAERVAEANISPAARTVNFAITTTTTALSPTGFKMLSLYGRDADGMALQSNLIYCPGSPTGQQCQ